MTALCQAAEQAYNHLMNLQPHLANGLLTPKQLEFIDPHIDAAMQALSKVIEAPPNSTTQIVESTIPEGWQLVPKEPTEEILDAICHAKNQTKYGLQAVMRQSELESIYKAMLAAAPKLENTP